MGRFSSMNPRLRLVHHVQELERLAAVKLLAVENLKTGFEAAQADGYDTTTLRVVLKLRKMTPHQRRERRALEAIYMAALGMLEGDSLPDEARRRLDSPPDEPPHTPEPPPDATDRADASKPDDAPRPPEQPALILKDPGEARTEGTEAAAAGKRIYDNPYPAGDPCRAAWDEGWCAQQKSHGMEAPAAFQRRTEKPPDTEPKGHKDDKGDTDRGAEKGAA